jgi:hypothetical protein
LKLSIIIQSSLFILFAVLSSCKKQEALSFDYHGMKSNLIIQPGNVSSNGFEGVSKVYFNADSLATANKFPKEALQSVSVNRIEFYLISGTDNLSLLNEVNGAVADTGKTNYSDIFTSDKVSSKNSTKMMVTGISQNIKDKVVSANYFSLKLKGLLSGQLNNPIVMEVRFTCAVTFRGPKL